MRYKRKYVLFILAFGWAIWYLEIITGESVGRLASVRHHSVDNGPPDISRFKITKETANTFTAPSKKQRAIESYNATITHVTDGVKELLATPGWIHNIVPHIKNEKYVFPRVRWSQNRTNVSIVIGIPTIKRPSNDVYIIDTLQSFFDSMNDEERSDVIIVVAINEPWDNAFESDLLGKLKERFPAQLEEGVLEVIAPHPKFYPDLEKIKLSLGDPKTRVKWRSKQNMDYGFLMIHCLGKGKYYLQMEDDISTVSGFMSFMKSTVSKETKSWLSLSFSLLGYIGRLYHIAEVRGIMEYLLRNFDKKPCDWLQYDYIKTRVCKPGPTTENCRAAINNQTWVVKPTIFQHKGLRSSFQGNINKLQDKYFLRGNKKDHYPNPKAAAIITSLTTHGKHTLNAVYYSKGFFWGTAPVKGDDIEFLYDPPVSISKIVMMSGNRQHPRDFIGDASVEILPATEPRSNSSLHTLDSVPYRDNTTKVLESQRVTALPVMNGTASSQHFYVLGSFSDGNAELTVAPDVGGIRIIRIRFHNNLSHWVILDQILIL